jgi:hypothetical protein
MLAKFTKMIRDSMAKMECLARTGLVLFLLPRRHAYPNANCGRCEWTRTRKHVGKLRQPMNFHLITIGTADAGLANGDKANGQQSDRKSMPRVDINRNRCHMLNTSKRNRQFSLDILVYIIYGISSDH